MSARVATRTASRAVFPAYIGINPQVSTQWAVTVHHCVGVRFHVYVSVIHVVIFLLSQDSAGVAVNSFMTGK